MEFWVKFKHKKLVNTGNWAEGSLRIVLCGFLETSTNSVGEEKRSPKIAFSYNVSADTTLSSRLISNSWIENSTSRAGMKRH